MKFTFLFLCLNCIVRQKFAVCHSGNEKLGENVVDEVDALYSRILAIKSPSIKGTTGREKILASPFTLLFTSSINSFYTNINVDRIHDREVVFSGPLQNRKMVFCELDCTRIWQCPPKRFQMFHQNLFHRLITHKMKSFMITARLTPAIRIRTTDFVEFIIPL